MKKHMFAFLFLLTSIPFLGASQSKPIRLIVRGDDMGFSHSGNEALIKCYKEGIERSIEVLVPSPWFPEAVKLLEKNPGVDVGVHLALTSEWESIKWRPLTNCPSLTDSDGYFYSMIWPNKNYGKDHALIANNWKPAEVEKEFRAQIEMAIKKIPGISHISTHMGCNNISKEINTLVKKLAKEYKIDIEPADYGVIGTGYRGPTTAPEQKINSFIKMLDSLKPGQTYVFVDHPGLDGPELRSIYHIGYENVAEDRQGVTDLYTSAKVKEAIKKRGIQLISYADLKK
jgi:chitin disaccharide deacetylase